MKKFEILLFLGILFIQSSYANTKDSIILSVTKQTKTIEERVQKILEEAESNFYNDNKLAKELINYCLDLTDRKNLDTSYAKSLTYLGIYYEVIEKYDSSLITYDKAFEIFKANKNLKGIGSINNNKGLIYWMQSDLDKAQEYFFKALKIFEELKNYKKMGSAYNNISLVYSDAKNYIEAIKYNYKAIENFKKSNEDKQLGAAYNNIGTTYFFLENIDSAGKYYRLSLDLHKKIKNDYGYSIALAGFAETKLNDKKYEEAEEFFDEAIKIKTKIGDSIGLVSIFLNKASLLNKTNKINEAIYYTESAHKIASGKKMLKKLYVIKNNLALYYSQKGNYKEAYNLMADAASLADTVNTIATRENIQHLNVRYENEKKVALINKQKNEIREKNFLLFGSIFSLAMFGLLAWVIFRNLKNKSRAALKEQQLIAKINASKSIFNAEENERLRIAKDLHDGIGQLLSAMKLNLQTLDDKQLENPTIVKVLDIVDDCASEARQIAHNIMPHHLIEKGLSFALKDLVEKVNNPKLEVKMDIIGLEHRLDAELEIPIYRIIQESINNIIRHSKATSVYISLEKDSDNITCSIEDNGIGFDTNNTSKKGIGLENMESRILYLNGTLEIHSQINKGTLLTFNLPQKMSFEDE